MELLTAVLGGVLGTFTQNLMYMAAFAVVFSALTIFDSQACNPGKPWWKGRDLVTDILFSVAYEFINPLLRIIAITMFMVILFGLSGGADVTQFFQEGHGPLSSAPFWAQVAFYLLASDLLLYGSHRLFHGRRLWAFHAVHHSPVDLDWTASYRTHPINRLFGPTSVTLIMMMLGVPPAVMTFLVPFDLIMGAWVHSNLNWTLGPLKYVIATPVFHRWHHTGIDEGGEKNFAPTFAFIDVLFGTFYMPEGKLPSNYGVDDKNYPTDILNQMIVPFIKFRNSFKPKKKKAVVTEGPDTPAGGA